MNALTHTRKHTHTRTLKGNVVKGTHFTLFIWPCSQFVHFEVTTGLKLPWSNEIEFPFPQTLGFRRDIYFISEGTMFTHTETKY